MLDAGYSVGDALMNVSQYHQGPWVPKTGYDHPTCPDGVPGRRPPTAATPGNDDVLRRAIRRTRFKAGTKVSRVVIAGDSGLMTAGR